MTTCLVCDSEESEPQILIVNSMFFFTLKKIEFINKIIDLFYSLIFIFLNFLTILEPRQFL